MLAKYDNEPFRGIPYQESSDDVWIQFYNDTTVMTNGDIKAVSTTVDYTDTSNPILKATMVAVSQIAAPGVIIAVVDDPRGTVPASTWGRAKIRGCVKASVSGDAVDVAVGDQLKVVAAATEFTVAQAASATSATIGTGVIISVNASAIALEANTGVAASKWVYLLGYQSVVA
jgi:hypothetical protein